MSDDRKGEAVTGSAGRQPILLIPAVIAALGGLMLAIQLASSVILDQEGQLNLIVWFGVIPARLMAPGEFPAGLLPLLWSPITYAFLHAGWEHVIGNVAWLAIFGTPVARRYGAVPTLAIFAISSILGAVAFAVTSFNGVGYLVGASGGIAGLTGAAMRFIFQPLIVAKHPETGEPVVLGRRLASIPEMLKNPTSRNFSVFWIVANCLVPILPLLIGQQIQISWQAHLAGFFTGLFLAPLFERPMRDLPLEPPQPGDTPQVPPAS